MTLLRQVHVSLSLTDTWCLHRPEYEQTRSLDHSRKIQDEINPPATVWSVFGVKELSDATKNPVSS